LDDGAPSRESRFRGRLPARAAPRFGPYAVSFRTKRSLAASGGRVRRRRLRFAGEPSRLWMGCGRNERPPFGPL